MHSTEKIIRLTDYEALVFYDFLWRFSETGKLQIVDQAEERVLWNILARLEKQTAEIFNPNFVELLTQARDIVRDEESNI